MLHSAREAYATRIGIIQRVKQAVRGQLEALQAGDYIKAFDDTPLEDAVGDVQPHKDIDVAGQPRAKRSHRSMLSDAVEWISSAFEEMNSAPVADEAVSPNTMQAWRVRITDRAAELSARLEALDALEKIRARELEQLLASHSTASAGEGDKERGDVGGGERLGMGEREGGCVSPPGGRSSGEGHGQSAGDGVASIQGKPVAEANSGTGAGGSARPKAWAPQFTLPEALVINDEAIRAQLDALARVWQTSTGAWSLFSPKPTASETPMPIHEGREASSTLAVKEGNSQDEGNIDFEQEKVQLLIEATDDQESTQG